MNTEIINMFVKALITFAVYVVMLVILPWFKNKIGEQQYAQIKEYTNLAVRTAEMLFTIDEYKEKKQYALDYVNEKIKEMGINMTHEDINNLIESTVNEIKYTYEQTKNKE